MRTRCTKCETIFNVTEEQLALRDGLVRCGICKNVFNGQEALLPEEVDDFPVLEHEQAVWPEEPVVAGHEVSNIYPENNRETRKPDLAEQPEPSVLQDEPDFHMSHDAGIYGNESKEPRLGGQSWQDEPEPIILHNEPSGIYDHEPLRMDVDDTENYVADSYQPRNTSIFWILGIFLGIIALIGQGLVVYRNQLVNIAPSLRPTLQHICQVTGCELGSDKNLASLQLKNWVLKPDLAAKPQEGVTALRLQFTLRNNDARAQVWPLLVIHLKNQQGLIEITKILEPQEYVQANLLGQKFQPGTEVFINVPLAVFNVAVSGFELSLVYP
ncbi:zinc-ribbon and DUF3426 domain-containing protein [Advenella sp. RU8]|uniref:zinc-ribbon and DUF3426 domain-containing protein n=1 Tax=Advenella sp. RU8 TaxID=3399575 RepID=UPI003AACC953